MEHTYSIKIGGTKWNKHFIPNIPLPSFLTNHHSHRPPPPATATGHHHLRPPLPPPHRPPSPPPPPPATITATTTTSGHRHRPPPATVTATAHHLQPSATSGNVGVNWSFNQSCSVPSSLVMSYQTLNSCPVLFCSVMSCPVQSCPDTKRILKDSKSIQIKKKNELL